MDVITSSTDSELSVQIEALFAHTVAGVPWLDEA